MSPSVGELKIISAVSSGAAAAGASSSTGGAASGAAVVATVTPMTVTSPRSIATVPLTCNHRPVSTLASTDRSNPRPRGRRSVTQMAASAERRTKSYRLLPGALGRSPNRLRPWNCPTTVTFCPSNRHGWRASARTEGDVASCASATAVTLRMSSSPGRGHRSGSFAPSYAATRGSAGSSRPTSISCPRTSTNPVAER